MSNLLQNLRVATRPAHEALERALGLGDASLTRERYVTVLQDFYGFYLPLEPHVPAYAAGAERQKAPLLERDLIALGMTPHDLAALPRCQHVPDLSTPHRRLGCMYVLEGSTLGGQHVLKHVARNLGLTAADSGTAFFNSYGGGGRVAAMWKAFLADMERHADTPPAQDQVIAAACQTFERFYNWVARRNRPS